MSIQEPTTIGLSKDAHRKLQDLKEQEHFGEMVDAYRFAISLALAHGAIAEETKNRQTIFNVGTVDPDNSIKIVVGALRDPELKEPIYRTAERLAEWGIEELYKLSREGEIPFHSLFQKANELT